MHEQPYKSEGCCVLLADSDALVSIHHSAEEAAIRAGELNTRRDWYRQHCTADHVTTELEWELRIPPE